MQQIVFYFSQVFKLTYMAFKTKIFSSQPLFQLPNMLISATEMIAVYSINDWQSRATDTISSRKLPKTGV